LFLGRRSKHKPPSIPSLRKGSLKRGKGLDPGGLAITPKERRTQDVQIRRKCLPSRGPCSSVSGWIAGKKENDRRGGIRLLFEKDLFIPDSTWRRKKPAERERLYIPESVS